MSDLGPRRYRIADYAAPLVLAQANRPSRCILRAVVSVSCWFYAAIVLGLWGATSWSAGDLWLPHLFLYGPRWMASLPVLLLAPLVAWLRLRWSVLPLGVAMISFVEIWGFNVPWGNLAPDDDVSGPSLRVLTCNVQHGDLRVHDLADLIQQAQPDVVFLQECSLTDPHDVLGQGDWRVRSAGEFCVASRYPIQDFEELHRPDKTHRITAVRTRLSWSQKTIPIASVHLMTPRRGLEAMMGTRSGGVGSFKEIAAVQRFESELLRRWFEQSSASTLLAGDFNLTVEHPLYRRDWSGYTDAFSRTSWGLGHTMFTRKIGLRIDHILCGRGWRPKSCWVGPDVGSAHRPVIADLIEHQ
jgi:vancomycin resistance protein VanJ